MKGNIKGFENLKEIMTVACAVAATLMVAGPGQCGVPAQKGLRKFPLANAQSKPQISIQSHAQTLPSFGGTAAAADTGEEKSFRILTVKHIPARGVASLFKDAEIIATEVFVQPAGGGFGGGFGGQQGGFGGQQGGFGGGFGGQQGGFGGGGMMGGGGFGGGMMGGGGGFGGGMMGGGGGFGGGGFGGGGFGF